MLSINDKLRLITEGYSLEEIKTEQPKFTNMIAESSRNYNEITMMIESVNTDLTFIQEANVEYLQESVLGTVAEKIKKFFAWVAEKIMNVIRWIKGKFSKKSEQANTVATRVEKKVKSGELKQKVEAIKSGNEEQYKEAVDKFKSDSKPDDHTHKTELDVAKLRDIVADPEKFDNFVNDNLRNGGTSTGDAHQMPSKEILKVHVKEKIISGDVPDLGAIAVKLVSIIKASESNVESFRTALIHGVSATKLATGEDILKILVNMSTGNKVSDLAELQAHALGDHKEFEIGVENVSTATKLLGEFKSQGEDIFKAYNDMKDLLGVWREKSLGIVEKYKESGEVKPETINKRVQQIIKMIVGAVTILNTLLALKSDGLTDCEIILNKLDSL